MEHDQTQIIWKLQNITAQLIELIQNCSPSEEQNHDNYEMQKVKFTVY